MEVASLFVLVAVAGVVELIRRAFARDWQGVIIISLSAVVGLLAGLFGIEGLTPDNGIIAGLAASGLITVASKFGNNTSPSIEK
jgi:xanthine/uracil permease